MSPLTQASTCRLLARALCAALALSVLAIAPATASAIRPPRAHAAPAELPPQGVYEACDQAGSGDGCLERLARIRGGGFTLVLNYRVWWASADQLRRYAEAADRLGMKIIWPFDSEQWRTGADLRARYPELAATCGCSDNAGYKRYVIGLVKDLPATWGYYVGDEVPWDQRAQAAALSDEIKALDPAHPRLFVSMESPTTAGANLQPFAHTADVLAGDWYPIGTDSADTVGTVAHDVGRVAQAHGKPSGMVLQAFSWEQYPGHQNAVPRWPTVAETTRMRDLAIQHAQPSLILWYSYYDIARSADSERHWADLVAGAFAPLPRDPEPTSPAPEPAAPERPATASPPASPVRATLRVPSLVHRSSARRPLLRWRLNGTNTAELAVFRVVRGKRVPVRRVNVRGRSGRVAIASLVRRGQPGRYVVRLSAQPGPAVAQSGFRVLR